MICEMISLTQTRQRRQCLLQIVIKVLLLVYTTKSQGYANDTPVLKPSIGYGTDMERIGSSYWTTSQTKTEKLELFGAAITDGPIVIEHLSRDIKDSQVNSEFYSSKLNANMITSSLHLKDSSYINSDGIKAVKWISDTSKLSPVVINSLSVMKLSSIYDTVSNSEDVYQSRSKTASSKSETIRNNKKSSRIGPFSPLLLYGTSAEPTMTVNTDGFRHVLTKSLKVQMSLLESNFGNDFGERYTTKVEQNAPLREENEATNTLMTTFKHSHDAAVVSDNLKETPWTEMEKYSHSEFNSFAIDNPHYIYSRHSEYARMPVQSAELASTHRPGLTSYTPSTLSQYSVVLQINSSLSLVDYSSDLSNVQSYAHSVSSLFHSSKQPMPFLVANPYNNVGNTRQSKSSDAKYNLEKDPSLYNHGEHVSPNELHLIPSSIQADSTSHCMHLLQASVFSKSSQSVQEHVSDEQTMDMHLRSSHFTAAKTYEFISSSFELFLTTTHDFTRLKSKSPSNEPKRSMTALQQLILHSNVLHSTISYKNEDPFPLVEAIKASSDSQTDLSIGNELHVKSISSDSILQDYVSSSPISQDKGLATHINVNMSSTSVSTSLPVSNLSNNHLLNQGDLYQLRLKEPTPSVSGSVINAHSSQQLNTSTVSVINTGFSPSLATNISNIMSRDETNQSIQITSRTEEYLTETISVLPSSNVVGAVIPFYVTKHTIPAPSPCLGKTCDNIAEKSSNIQMMSSAEINTSAVEMFSKVKMNNDDFSIADSPTLSFFQYNAAKAETNIHETQRYTSKTSYLKVTENIIPFSKPLFLPSESSLAIPVYSLQSNILTIPLTIIYSDTPSLKYTDIPPLSNSDTLFTSSSAVYPLQKHIIGRLSESNYSNNISVIDSFSTKTSVKYLTDLNLTALQILHTYQRANTNQPLFTSIVTSFEMSKAFFSEYDMTELQESVLMPDDKQPFPKTELNMPISTPRMLSEQRMPLITIRTHGLTNTLATINTVTSSVGRPSGMHSSTPVSMFLQSLPSTSTIVPIGDSDMFPQTHPVTSHIYIDSIRFTTGMSAHLPVLTTKTNENIHISLYVSVSKYSPLTSGTTSIVHPKTHPDVFHNYEKDNLSISVSSYSPKSLYSGKLKHLRMFDSVTHLEDAELQSSALSYNVQITPTSISLSTQINTRDVSTSANSHSELAPRFSTEERASNVDFVESVHSIPFISVPPRAPADQHSPVLFSKFSVQDTQLLSSSFSVLPFSSGSLVSTPILQFDTNMSSNIDLQNVFPSTSVEHTIFLSSLTRHWSSELSAMPFISDISNGSYEFHSAKTYDRDTVSIINNSINSFLMQLMLAENQLTSSVSPTHVNSRLMTYSQITNKTGKMYLAKHSPTVSASIEYMKSQINFTAIAPRTIRLPKRSIPIFSDTSSFDYSYSPVHPIFNPHSTENGAFVQNQNGESDLIDIRQVFPLHGSVTNMVSNNHVTRSSYDDMPIATTHFEKSNTPFSSSSNYASEIASSESQSNITHMNQDMPYLLNRPVYKISESSVLIKISSETLETTRFAVRPTGIVLSSYKLNPGSSESSSKCSLTSGKISFQSFSLRPTSKTTAHLNISTETVDADKIVDVSSNESTSLLKVIRHYKKTSATHLLHQNSENYFDKNQDVHDHSPTKVVGDHKTFPASNIPTQDKDNYFKHTSHTLSTTAESSKMDSRVNFTNPINSTVNIAPDGILSGVNPQSTHFITPSSYRESGFQVIESKFEAAANNDSQFELFIKRSGDHELFVTESELSEVEVKTSRFTSLHRLDQSLQTISQIQMDSSVVSHSYKLYTADISSEIPTKNSSDEVYSALSLPVFHHKNEYPYTAAPAPHTAAPAPHTAAPEYDIEHFMSSFPLISEDEVQALQSKYTELQTEAFTRYNSFSTNVANGVDNIFFQKKNALKDANGETVIYTSKYSSDVELQPSFSTQTQSNIRSSSTFFTVPLIPISELSSTDQFTKSTFKRHGYFSEHFITEDQLISSKTTDLSSDKSPRLPTKKMTESSIVFSHVSPIVQFTQHIDPSTSSKEMSLVKLSVPMNKIMKRVSLQVNATSSNMSTSSDSVSLTSAPTNKSSEQESTTSGLMSTTHIRPNITSVQVSTNNESGRTINISTSTSSLHVSKAGIAVSTINVQMSKPCLQVNTTGLPIRSDSFQLKNISKLVNPTNGLSNTTCLFVHTSEPTNLNNIAESAAYMSASRIDTNISTTNVWMSISNSSVTKLNATSSNSSQLVNTSRIPVSANTEQASTTDVLVTTTNTPVILTTVKGSTSSVLVNTTYTPVSTISERMSLTGAIVNMTRVQVSSSSVLASTSLSVKIVSTPVSIAQLSYNSEPENTTGDLVKTVSVPVSTTSTDVKTSSISVSTTSAPVNISSEPMNTTSVRVNTIRVPVKIMRVLTSTTNEPFSTTGAGVGSNSISVNTANIQVNTTNIPVNLISGLVTSATVSTISEEQYTGTLDTMTSIPVNRTSTLGTNDVLNLTSMLLSMTSVPAYTSSTSMKASSISVRTTNVPVNIASELVNKTTVLMNNIVSMSAISEQLNTNDGPVSMQVSSISVPVNAASEAVSISSVLVNTTILPVSTTTLPVSTSGGPVNRTDVPVNTVSESEKTTNIQMSTIHVPLSTVDVPVSTTSLPVSNTGLPVNTASVSVSVTSVPVRTDSIPVSTVSVPVRPTNVPMSTVSDLVNIASVPENIANVPIGTTNIQVRTMSVPVSTTSVQVSATSAEVSTLIGDTLIATSFQVRTAGSTVNTANVQESTANSTVSTASVPVSTVTVAIHTTSAQVSTTSVPVSNTNTPVSTLGAANFQVRTTGVPLRTDSLPMSTTSVQVSTVSLKVNTFSVPMSTTTVQMSTLSAASFQVRTTREPLRTDILPVSTVSLQVSTFSVPMSTTSVPVSSASNTVSSASVQESRVNRTVSVPVSTVIVAIHTTSLLMSTVSVLVSNANVPVSTVSVPVSNVSVSASIVSVPVGTDTLPVSTTRVPVSTASVQVNTTSASVNTASVLVSTASIPMNITSVSLNTNHVPTSTTSIPESTTSVPVGTVSVPLSTVSVPVSTVSISMSTVTIPISTTSVLVSTANFPLSTASIPMSIASVPVNTNHVPTSTTSVPVSTVNVPMSTASIPMNITSVPLNTNHVPTSTTSIPKSTAGVSVGTVSVPLSTASVKVSTVTIPISTTSVPMSTASGPVSPTSGPVSTASGPVNTNHVPISTTSIPESTASVPVATVSVPLGTTRAQVRSISAPKSTGTLIKTDGESGMHVSPSPTESIPSFTGISTISDIPNVPPLKANLVNIRIQVKVATNIHGTDFIVLLELGLLKCYMEGLAKGGYLTPGQRRQNLEQNHERGAGIKVTVISTERGHTDDTETDVRFYVIDDRTTLTGNTVELVFSRLNLVQTSAFLGYPVVKRVSASVPLAASPASAQPSFFTPRTVVLISVPTTCVVIAAAVLLYLYCREPVRGQRTSVPWNISSLKKSALALDDLGLVIDFEHGKVVPREFTSKSAEYNKSSQKSITQVQPLRLQQERITGHQELSVHETVLNTQTYQHENYIKGINNLKNVLGDIYKRGNDIKRRPGKCDAHVKVCDGLGLAGRCDAHVTVCEDGHGLAGRCDAHVIVCEDGLGLASRCDAHVKVCEDGLGLDGRCDAHVKVCKDGLGLAIPLQSPDILPESIGTLYKNDITNARYGIEEASSNETQKFIYRIPPILTKNESYEVISETSSFESEISDVNSFDSKQAYISGKDTDNEGSLCFHEGVGILVYNTDYTKGDAESDITKPLSNIYNGSFTAKRVMKHKRPQKTMNEYLYKGNLEKSVVQMKHIQGSAENTPYYLSLAPKHPVEGYCDKIVQKPYSSLTLGKVPRNVNNFMEGDLEDDVFLPEIEDSSTLNQSSHKNSPIEKDNHSKMRPGVTLSSIKTNDEYTSKPGYSSFKSDSSADYCVPWDILGLRFHQRFYSPDRSHYTDGSEYAGDEFESVNFKNEYKTLLRNTLNFRDKDTSGYPQLSDNLGTVKDKKKKMTSEMFQQVIAPDMLDPVTKMSRVSSRQPSPKFEFGPQFRPLPYHEIRAQSRLESSRTVSPIESFKEPHITPDPPIDIEKPRGTHVDKRKFFQPYEEMKLGRNMRAAPRGSLGRQNSTVDNAEIRDRDQFAPEMDKTPDEQQKLLVDINCQKHPEEEPQELRDADRMGSEVKHIEYVYTDTPKQDDAWYQSKVESDIEGTKPKAMFLDEPEASQESRVEPDINEIKVQKQVQPDEQLNELLPSNISELFAPPPAAEDLYASKISTSSVTQHSTQHFSPGELCSINYAGETSSNSVISSQAVDQYGTVPYNSKQGTVDDIEEIKEEIDIENSTDKDRLSDDDFHF